MWELIWKWAHMQLVREHSATIVSACSATVDWSWPTEWNWCAQANLNFFFLLFLKCRQGMNGWTFSQNPPKQGKCHHQSVHELIQKNWKVPSDIKLKLGTQTHARWLYCISSAVHQPLWLLLLCLIPCFTELWRQCWFNLAVPKMCSLHSADKQNYAKTACPSLQKNRKESWTN